MSCRFIRPNWLHPPRRPDWIDNWSGLERADYEKKKEEVRVPCSGC